MPFEYHVGDRVRCMHVMDGNRLVVGKTGTVVTISIRKDELTGCEHQYLGVAFDEYVNGHDCAEKCKYGYGYYIHDYYCEPEFGYGNNWDIQINTSELNDALSLILGV